MDTGGESIARSQLMLLGRPGFIKHFSYNCWPVYGAATTTKLRPHFANNQLVKVSRGQFVITNIRNQRCRAKTFFLGSSSGVNAGGGGDRGNVPPLPFLKTSISMMTSTFMTPALA